MNIDNLNLALLKLENALMTYKKDLNYVGKIRVVFLGSQSILFFHDNIVSNAVIASYEIDIILNIEPFNKKIITSLSNNINFAYGYQSDFHEKEFFFIDDMTNEENQYSYIEKFPINWQSRSITVLNKNDLEFLCLDKHDVCVLKLIANRDKDIDYVCALIQGSLINKKKLLKSLNDISKNFNKEKLQSIKNKIKYFYSLPQINILNKKN